MNKCDCYHIEKRRVYGYNPVTGDPIGYDVYDGVCWGTKERENCSCGGNEIKCDFYPEVRKKARKEQKPKFGKWISVEDRLPEPFVSVLGYMTDAGDFPPVRECYSVGGKAFFFPALKDAHPVSHWMPLPQPPKGE